MVGLFFSALMHEINQPLNAVKIGADGVLLKTEIDPDYEISTKGTVAVLSRISKSIEYIDSVLKQFSKYQDDGSFEGNGYDKISNIAKQSYNLFKSKIASHGIMVREIETKKCTSQSIINPVALEMMINCYLLAAINSFDFDENIENKEILISSTFEVGYQVMNIAINSKSAIDCLQNTEKCLEEQDEYVLAEIFAKNFGAEVEFFIDERGLFMTRIKVKN